MTEVVYLNGSLIPASRAKVSVFDQGFLYGYGLFETMRSYHGKIFLLERHIKRLLDAAETIRLAPGLGGIDLGKACEETLKANDLEEARLRLTVSRGEVAAFSGTNVGSKPTVLVTARRYTPLPAERYRRGFKAGVASRRRCRQSLLSRIKSANYLVSVLARMEAGAAGLDEALLLNEQGSVAEGSASNVFFARASGLVTPSLESGILPGITREVVMELAGGLGMSVTEADVSLDEFKQCEEAFLTNSMIEIMPLVSVSDQRGQDAVVGSGKPGEITKRLMAAYQAMVDRETGQRLAQG